MKLFALIFQVKMKVFSKRERKTSRIYGFFRFFFLHPPTPRNIFFPLLPQVVCLWLVIKCVWKCVNFVASPFNMFHFRFVHCASSDNFSFINCTYCFTRTQISSYCDFYRISTIFLFTDDLSRLCRSPKRSKQSELFTRQKISFPKWRRKIKFSPE